MKVKPDESESWITVREAAVQLRNSYGQTLRLLEIGDLEGKRTAHGRWWINRDSVNRMVEDRLSMRSQAREAHPQAHKEQAT